MAKIINTSLVESLEMMYDDKSEVLIIEDNDTKHKSKIVKNAIQHHNLTVLDGYPANSPDLNPIENIWDIWDRMVHAHHPKTLEELDLWANIEWDRLRCNTELLNKLVMRYKNRC